MLVIYGSIYHYVAAFLDKTFEISIFMGMSGNWKYVKTEDWNKTKYTRLRFDDSTGHSLILYGGYMGPKYKFGKFLSTERGPDIIKDINIFKSNIIDNLNDKIFLKSLVEILLDQKYFNGIGAYLASEILGRLQVDPFRTFDSLSRQEINNLLNLIYACLEESYKHGGGEIKDWHNPFGKSTIKEWLKFYGNKDRCYKQKFGKRNIWIDKKFKKHE